MNIDELLKKIYALKDLRQAISVVKSSGLDKAEPVKSTQEPQPEAKPEQALGNWKHAGINMDSPRGHSIVTHKVKLHDGHPHHYEIDADMSKKPSQFALHKVRSSDGQTVESHSQPHKDLSSAIRALLHREKNGNWE